MTLRRVGCWGSGADYDRQPLSPARILGTGAGQRGHPRKDIDCGQIKSMAEELSRLPGVDIGQNGGFGQKSSPFICGTNASYALVLIDGVRMNQAGISGASDLSQIPIALVQRIEYIRRPRSAVYGSDAIGGVVNIMPPENRTAARLAPVWTPTVTKPMTVLSVSNWGENTTAARFRQRLRF